MNQNDQSPKNSTALRTNEEIIAFINMKPMKVFRKPDDIGTTAITYEHLGFDQGGDVKHQDLLYTVARLYQNMMAINRAQILNDPQAGREVDFLLVVMKELPKIKEYKQLKARCELVYFTIKRIIETCELKRGFLAFLFPRWV